MLKVENLHASVGDKEILKGINLEVKAGEVVELPILKNRWGVLVLAKSIEY